MDTNLKTFLPKVEGTEDVFDYIRFLEDVLTDLKDILSALSKKFIEDFNLTMVISSTERYDIIILNSFLAKNYYLNIKFIYPRVKQKKPTQPSKYDDLPCLECIELRKEADQSSGNEHPFNEDHFTQKNLCDQSKSLCSCFMAEPTHGREATKPFSFCKEHFQTISWTKLGPCICFVYNKNDSRNDLMDNINISVDLIPVFPIEPVEGECNIFNKVFFISLILFDKLIQMVHFVLDHSIDCQEETLWMARLLEQIFENQLSTSRI